MELSQIDIVLGGITGEMMELAHQHIDQTDGLGSVFHEYVGTLQLQPEVMAEVMSEVEAFGIWLEDQLQPRRSRRETPAHVLDDVRSSLFISHGKIFTLKLYYKSDREHYALPFRVEQGISCDTRVYSARTGEMIVVQVSNVGAQERTIVSVYEDPKVGDVVSRSDSKVADVASRSHKFGCTLSADETDCRRLELEDGRLVVKLKIIACES